MRLSVEWLGEHVDLSDQTPEGLGDLITLHVAEVDDVGEPGGGWPGVRVAHVTAMRPHPNADKLKVCSVDTGEGDRVRVEWGRFSQEFDTPPDGGRSSQLPDAISLDRFWKPMSYMAPSPPTATTGGHSSHSSSVKPFQSK